MSQHEDILTRAACITEDLEQRRFHELLRPFRMMLTTISRDGNKWCVLYGENLQDGVAGFGDSPDEASRDFDKAWYERMRL
jgi:hypothetical protein